MVHDMKVLVKQAILKACSWWGCYRVNCFSYIKTEKFSCPRENHRWYAGSQALVHHWAHMEVIPWRGKLLFGNSSLFHSKPFSSLSCLHVLLHLGTVRFVAKYKQAKLSSNDAGRGETPSPSPPPQRQRVSPYNKDGMKGLTNSVNARSCSPERTQSPPDAAGIGKEKPKASDDDDGGGKDKFRGTSFFWHFDV